MEISSLRASFTNFNGLPHFGIVRLKPDGSVDPSFTYDARIGTNGISCVAQQPDDKIIIGGEFEYSGDFPGPMARLNSDGSLDASFAPEISHDWWPGYMGMITTEAYHIGNIIVRTNGQILFGGAFTRIDTSKCPPGTSIVGYDEAGAIALDAKGNVLAEGYYITSSSPAYRDGPHVEYFRRFGAGGTLDNSFNPQLNNSSSRAPLLSYILTQPDGKIVIVGSFNSVGTDAHNRIARLNANGTLDEHFYAQASSDKPAVMVALQANGNYLLGGGFTLVNDVSRCYLARLYGDDLSPREPAIIRQPTSVELGEGSTTNFSVVADGPSLAYQWRLNEADIPGATNELFVLTNAQSANAGTYVVVITNAWGSVTSAPVQLAVVRTLGEALNAQGLVWNSAIIKFSKPTESGLAILSSPGWKWQTNFTHDGVTAIQNIFDSMDRSMLTAHAFLQTRVIGPGQLSFWYFGKFGFALSTARTTNEFVGPALWNTSTNFGSVWPNPVLWQKFTINVPPGEQTLIWYSSTADENGGAVQAIDEVSFIPSPRMSCQPSSQSGGNFQFSLIGPTNAIFQIERSIDLKQRTALQIVTNVSGTLNLSDPSPDKSPCSFYRAIQQ